MTLEELEELKTKSHNRRSLLSIYNYTYNPLGVVSSFTVSPKLLMRHSWSELKFTDWDKNVRSHLIGKWAQTIEEATKAEQLNFQRSTTPLNGVKKPSIIGSSDGSEQALSEVVYMVSKIYKDQTNQSNSKRLIKLWIGIPTLRSMRSQASRSAPKQG